jgi:Cu(I)/Ag(I) efflux system membrane fusion protein
LNSRFIHLICVLFMATSAASCSKHEPSKPAEKTLYTCSMHPQVVQDHPGDCPICGMKLMPVRKQPSSATKHERSTGGARKVKYYKSTMMLGEISQTPRKDSMGMDMVPVYEGEEETNAITVDPATVQKMGVRTAVVTKGPLRRVTRTVGTIDYNETALADVTTKFRGWIEKLYVDSTGKQVHKGEPLFDIYSPELYSAQNEYVLALNQGSGGLKASARQKLKLFDVSDDQIAELEKARQPQRTLRVNAPIDGIVLEKMAVQGQMVEAGMKLYRLADLSIVWVQSQVYEQDLALLKLGQEAEVSLSYLPDRKFSGRVTYIYPTVDEKTRTARVRMEFHNPGLFLKPGMFATVELNAETEPSALLVPDSAVLRSGEKNTVFVDLDNGHFQPREVTLGPRAENNTYEVLSGLEAGERVVTSGQFMLDSESQLREAIQKMLNPNAPASPTPPSHAERAATAQLSSSAIPAPSATPASYECPMTEHASIKYGHPGKCPICGMTLIPTPEERSPTPSPSPSATEHQH